MQDYLCHLLVLHREQDWVGAAGACRVSEPELRASVRTAEAEFGHAIVRPGLPFAGFTPEGERVVTWARQFSAAVQELERFVATRKKAKLAPLLERRSVSPKRLGPPGPCAEDIRLMVEAALSAPDHGGLRPWRVLAFSAGQREALGELFEQEKLRRDPLASKEDILRAGEHATRSPELLAFIVSPKARTMVPEREQWLAAGAALGNFVNAAHQLGFGCIMLSGERCFDAPLCAALGLQPGEHLAGFISLGSVAEAPPARKPAGPDAVLSQWTPDVPLAPEQLGCASGPGTAA